MSTHSTTLTNELTSLANVFRDLGPRLAEAARNLEIAGQPPAEDTIALVQSARKRFVECRDATLRLAVSEKFPSPPSPDQLASVPDIEKLIQAIADLCAEREKQEKQRRLLQDACSVLDRVLSIQHKDGDFSPLRECQERARELKKAADSGQEAVDQNTYRQLAEGSHSFCDLLTLVERREDIDDARWEELESSITRAYSKALTIAATRGKLVVGTPQRAAPAAPAASPPSAPSAKLTMEAPAVATMLEAPAPTNDSHRSPKTLADDRTEMDLNLPADGNNQVHAADEEVVPTEVVEEAELVEEIVDEDPESQRRPHPDDIWHRSPLTAQQESELLAHGSGVTILFGSQIAGFEDIGLFLDIASGDVRLITLDAATDRAGFLRELDDLLKDRPDGMMLVVVPAMVPWTEEWILRSLEQVNRKASAKKLTRVLFLADPEAAWSWVRMDDDQRGQMRRDGLVELSLIPWTNTALRRWLNDVGLIDSDQYILERIARVTGNWGALIHQVGYSCQTEPKKWAEHLASFERELTSETEWEERLGLVKQAHVVLKTMAAMTQPVSTDKVAAKMEGTPRDRVDTVIRWADLLNYVHRSGHQLWTLDPVVRQVVLQRD